MDLATITTIELALNPKDLDKVPAKAAIYAIFEKPFNQSDQLKCRFVGTASNLKEVIDSHFSMRETNVSLRYFMISRKEKYLTYILTSDMDDSDVEMETRHWINTFKPDCNS